MATAIFGQFLDPETRSPVAFQTLTVEHLPGKPVFCPCWLRWVLQLLVLPFGVRLPQRLRVWWLKSPRYRLCHDLLFVAQDGTEWLVEAGFVFNGLSVPWWLFWLCPSDHPDAFAASCLHDKCCSKPYPCDYKKAGWLFWLAMRANGMYRWGAFRNWAGVRFGGPRFEAST